MKKSEQTRPVMEKGIEIQSVNGGVNDDVKASDDGVMEK